MSTKIGGQDDHSKKPSFELIIEGKKFEWFEQFITGKQVKNLAEISLDSDLYLKFKGNEADKLISNHDSVDLGQQDTEHFYTKSHGNDIVQIKINDHTYNVHRGRRTVVEIKNIGGVPLEYDLEQVIDGKLNLLGDNDAVTIKGGEIFLSHPKDGSSS